VLRAIGLGAPGTWKNIYDGSGEPTALGRAGWVDPQRRFSEVDGAARRGVPAGGSQAFSGVLDDPVRVELADGEATWSASPTWSRGRTNEQVEFGRAERSRDRTIAVLVKACQTSEEGAVFRWHREHRRPCAPTPRPASPPPLPAEPGLYLPTLPPTRCPVLDRPLEGTPCDAGGQVGLDIMPSFPWRRPATLSVPPSCEPLYPSPCP
jgi:hypothetical protein